MLIMSNRCNHATTSLPHSLKQHISFSILFENKICNIHTLFETSANSVVYYYHVPLLGGFALNPVQANNNNVNTV
jgi:hypothetical protein